MALMIKGDMLEGGGQILRIAIAMSALTGKSVVINNIRAKRKKPGLAAQHLTGLQLVQNISYANMEGAAIGAINISFKPCTLKGGLYNADTKTAGSIALLIQIALPCALFSDTTCSLRLKGGTNADMAPPIDYITQVFRPMLQKFGATFSYDILKRGFYPAGQGEVSCEITPVKILNSVDITDFGELHKLTIEAYFAGKISKSVADRIAETAHYHLKGLIRCPLQKKVVRWDSEEAFGTGFGVNIVGVTSTGCVFGSSMIGTRDKSAEDIGRAAANEITEIIERRLCVDQYMQDQLLIFMALAAGKSSIRTGSITLHTETAMHVIKQVCDAQFRVTNDGDANIIECVGVGLANQYI